MQGFIKEYLRIILSMITVIVLIVVIISSSDLSLDNLSNIVINFDNKINENIEYSNGNIIKINYVLNGGQNAPENPDSIVLIGEYTNFVLEDAIKEGCVFLGWFDDDDNKINEIKIGENKTITLYAKWEVLSA